MPHKPKLKTKTSPCSGFNQSKQPTSFDYQPPDPSPSKPHAQFASDSSPDNYPILFHPEALEDLAALTAYQPRIANKALKLIQDCSSNPWKGKGHPEHLKYFPHSGNIWSRRITDEHRLVYRVNSNNIEILQARYHY